MALRETFFIGRATGPGNEEFFYKIVGCGDAESYSMCLVATDCLTAYGAKFNLRDVKRALDREGTEIKNLPDLLEFLEAGFNSGRPVKAEVASGCQFVLLGQHQYATECLDLRLPPKGSNVIQLAKDSAGFTWACRNIMRSYLGKYQSCQRELADCLKQPTVKEEVVSISDFVNNGSSLPQQSAAAELSPSKRKAGQLGSPVEDMGSAMKHRPPGLAGAAPAAGEPSMLAGGAQAASEQPTAGTTVGTTGTAPAGTSGSLAASQQSKARKKPQGKGRPFVPGALKAGKKVG